MKYSLHPGAEEDLREAAQYYRTRAGNSLSQALFTEFEHAVGLLLRHPGLGAEWRYGKRRFVMRRFPYSPTVAALAKALGRDYKRVHADVDSLVTAGLLIRDKSGIRTPYDEVQAKLAL